MSHFKLRQPNSPRNRPTIKVGDVFPNKNIPDGRFGFGTVLDIKNGTTKPKGEI